MMPDNDYPPPPLELHDEYNADTEGFVKTPNSIIEAKTKRTGIIIAVYNYIAYRCFKEGGSAKLTTQQIADHLSFSHNQVTRAIKRLSSDNQVITKWQTKSTLYQVVKHKRENEVITKWQPSDNDRQRAEDRKKNTERRKERYLLSIPKTDMDDRANSDAIAIPKKRKKTNTAKEYTAVFEVFWSTYPRKDKKSNAFDAWQKIDFNGETTQELVIQSVKDHLETEQWQTRRFIPLATTYLNGRQWEDEITDEDKAESSKSTLVASLGREPTAEERERWNL